MNFLHHSETASLKMFFKQYIRILSLCLVFTIPCSLTFAKSVTSDMSTECREALETAFQDMGMRAEDLEDPLKAKTFKEHYKNTETWKELASKCEKTPLTSNPYGKACPCSGYGDCEMLVGGCFWNCDDC